MAQPLKYRAFISYSHRDRKWGEWLHRTLENYRVPSKIVGRETEYGPIPRRLTPIFRDRDELAAADDLGAEITAALEASMFLLVICSPASSQSKWVNEEIKAFKRMHGDNRVRAVIVGGEPFSGDAKTECFPEGLRFKTGEDGELTGERAEPIAADLRPGGDGKKYAISKLVAGLTGARLDDLIQREQARRNARMRVVAGGMSAVSLAFAGVAWEALKQRDAARIAQADAEQARDDAEGLVEFMLTDLRKSLDGVGRLDILEMPGKRALDYYDARDLATADPDSLGRRARAQLLVGEVDNLRGDLDSALAAYTAAAATTEEQLRRDPDNPDRIFDHSQSVFWVGYIAWQRGDADTARRYWTQYYDQARRLVEIDPNNDDYQAELMFAHSNLGTLQMDQGEAASAEVNFRAALDISLQIYGESPTDAASAIEVGHSYAWLSDALYHQVKIIEAREARESELKIYRAIPNYENNSLLSHRLSIAQYNLADILISDGLLSDAVREASQAAEIADRILAADSNNLEFADRAVLARSILGEAQLHAGKVDDAKQTLDSAILTADRLVTEDQTNLRWRGKVAALPELQLAILEERYGDFDLAESKIQSLIRTIQPLYESDVSELAILRLYLAALACQARINPAKSDNWNIINTSLERSILRHGPKTRTLAIEANANLGRNQEAIDIAGSLYSSDFRHPEFIRLIDAYPYLNPETD